MPDLAKDPASITLISPYDSDEKVWAAIIDF
jgi:hypothetical protein